MPIYDTIGNDSGTSHSGASKLSDLSDVDFAGLGDGAVPTWVAATGYVLKGTVDVRTLTVPAGSTLALGQDYSSNLEVTITAGRDYDLSTELDMFLGDMNGQLAGVPDLRNNVNPTLEVVDGFLAVHADYAPFSVGYTDADSTVVPAGPMAAQLLALAGDGPFPLVDATGGRWTVSNADHTAIGILKDATPPQLLWSPAATELSFERPAGVLPTPAGLAGNTTGFYEAAITAYRKQLTDGLWATAPGLAAWTLRWLTASDGSVLWQDVNTIYSSAEMADVTVSLGDDGLIHCDSGLSGDTSDSHSVVLSARFSLPLSAG